MTVPPRLAALASMAAGFVLFLSEPSTVTAAAEFPREKWTRATPAEQRLDEAKLFHTNLWDVGPGESASLPTKWFTQDGGVHLVFSGQDHFSVRRGSIVLRKK
jgi:hypothetical protein